MWIVTTATNSVVQQPLAVKLVESGSKGHLLDKSPPSKEISRRKRTHELLDCIHTWNLIEILPSIPFSIRICLLQSHFQSQTVVATLEDSSRTSSYQSLCQDSWWKVRIFSVRLTQDNWTKTQAFPTIWEGGRKALKNQVSVSLIRLLTGRATHFGKEETRLGFLHIE